MKHVESSKKISLFFIASTAFLTVLLYWPVLKAPFLLDDYSSIVNNFIIRTLNLSGIYHFAPLRFIGYLSFALNYHFSKLNPVPYHIVNITIHFLFLCSAFLLFLTLWDTPAGKESNFSSKEKQYISMGTTLLLTVHPLSVFAISYVTQRLASLTGLFYITAILFYIKIRLEKPAIARIINIFMFVLCMTGALFTKQNSFTIFPVLLTLEIICFKNYKKWLATGTALMIAALTTLALLFTGIFNLDKINRLTIETAKFSRLEYLRSQLSSICFYLSQALFPDRLAIDYKHTIYSSWTSPHVLIPGIILICVIIFAIRLMYYPKIRLASFGIFFYFIALSVESSIIPIRDTIFLHRTYLPNAGLFFSIVILAYYALKKINLPAEIIVTFFSIIILVFAVTTWKTNKIFKDPLRVWQKVVDISPDNERGHASIGSILLPRGQYKIAERHLLKAQHLQPGDYKNLNNIGLIYKNTGRYKKAIEIFKKVLSMKKDFTNAYINIGNTYVAMKKYKLAIKEYRKAYNYNKHNYKMLINFGQTLAATASPGDKKQLAEAMKLLNQAESISDRDPILYYAKGIACYNLKEFDNAEKQFKRSLELSPGFKQAKIFINDINKIKEFKKLIRKKNDDLPDFFPYNRIAHYLYSYSSIKEIKD